ncbi:MAG TPA: T9SS type A sorting domain-containing protein [Ignavibacteriaceae bacterium]|nr:T9SS type A sorting domain-containing protein [Ignavibacteriaceae bacterium]
MKSVFALVIFLLLCFNISYSQSWTEQNINEALFDEPAKVLVVNENVWFLISNFREIWRTTDGGANFYKILSYDNIRVDFSSIQYFNNKIFLVEDYEDSNYFKIKTSSDFGQTFQLVNKVRSYGQYQLSFIDDFNGWYIRQDWPTDHLYRTTDGGRTWEAAEGPHIGRYFYFFNKMEGYLNYKGNFLYKTIDGGKTLTKIQLPYNIENPSGFICLDSTLYFFGADSSGFRKFSVTKGIDVVNVLEDFPFPEDIIFSSSHLYQNNNIAIQSGLEWLGFYFSDDYGKTWSIRKLPAINIYTFAVNPDGSLLAFQKGGTIFKSTDSAKNWKCIANPIINDVRNVFFIDENTGWISGSNILKTTDGGNSWDYISTERTSLNIYFLNQAKGFMYSNGYIYKSLDGGLSWDSVYSTSRFINDIYFVDSILGFAVGRGVYLRTTDGGNSWESNQQDVKGLSINFCSHDLGFISGDSIGYRTNDGGKSWTPDSQLIGQEVFFLDSLIGMVANKRKLLRTTDGGKTFNTIIDDGYDDYISNLQFIDDNVGFVFSGRTKMLLKTTNKGLNWENFYSTISNYNSIFFVNEGIGWVVSLDGKIYKYSKNINSTELQDINQTNYSLNQNYPNPFNPTTKINYNIAKDGRASMVIYDVLGREVKKLFDEEKTKGNYSIELNASELSSGIYFYKLQTSDFSETKKMVLMK